MNARRCASLYGEPCYTFKLPKGYIGESVFVGARPLLCFPFDLSLYPAEPVQHHG